MAVDACQSILCHVTTCSYKIFLNLVAKETLEGHQRAMMGNMTVEEIYRERKTFSSAVFEVSKKDFLKFGMIIISYTLKDITDDVGYLKVRFLYKNNA